MYPVTGNFVGTFQVQELCNCRDVNCGRHRYCYVRQLIEANPYVESEKVIAPRLVSYLMLPESAVSFLSYFLFGQWGYFAVLS